MPVRRDGVAGDTSPAVAAPVEEPLGAGRRGRRIDEDDVSDARLSRFPGGKGGNQALAARRLGADVALIASVGVDEAARAAAAMP